DYDADKAILDTYRESTILKRRREDDDQEGPSAGSDRGSKRQKEGVEHASASTSSEIETGGAGRSTKGSQSRQLSASESAFAEEPVQTTCQMEEPPHPPRKPPLPDRDWNKTLPATQGDAQSWISDLARKTDARSSFNELLDTPIDFSNFFMNRLNVDTLTPELLAGPTYELMRGSFNSLTELEYHLEEVYKATKDQLDWVNPEGQHDVGVESIFTTAFSPIVSLQTPTPIMTPSTIATITTSGDAPIPSTIIPSIILENLPTFNSAFHFDERWRSFETTFSEYRQTNPFVDAMSAIPSIVHQYMT
nr:hypothetical protein [Tanacetum cinerariifolium]